MFFCSFSSSQLLAGDQMALLLDEAADVILVLLLLVKSGNFLVQRFKGKGSSVSKIKKVRASCLRVDRRFSTYL